MYLLPDTRPFPTDPVKNDLLLYAAQIARPTSQAQLKLARDTLRAKIAEMFVQNHTLGLSVAMSMAADAEQYTALMDTLGSVLNAADETQVQWFALPVILVAGAKQPLQLPTHAPTVELAACLANYPAWRPFSRATWLPQLIRAEDFARIKAEQWFAAAQNSAQAQAFADSLPTQAALIPSDQSVHALYALGYGDADLLAACGGSLNEAALPLMQVWQQHFSQDGLTAFANPLAPDTPLAALTAASHMRLRMALEVFAANAVRAVRLQNRPVGVVMAAAAGGRLLFGFGAADESSIQQQVFSWPLSPRENIGLVQQDFLNLMADCQVEHIRLLHQALPDEAALPDYPQAQNLSGCHPWAETAEHYS